MLSDNLNQPMDSLYTPQAFWVINYRNNSILNYFNTSLNIPLNNSGSNQIVLQSRTSGYYVYVTNTMSDSIASFKYDPLTIKLEPIATSQTFGSPTSMTLSSGARIFVTSSNVLSVYHTSGGVITLESSIITGNSPVAVLVESGNILE